MPKGVSATYRGAGRSAAARKGAATRALAKRMRGALAPAEPYVAPTPGALKATIDRALARIAAAKAREQGE